MSKVTLEELKQHCIKTIEACEQIKRIPNVRITDDRRSQEHKLVLQLIEEHEQRQSTDAVSREEAVKVLRADPSFICTGDKAQAITDILSLPPVTPERPKGEWISTNPPGKSDNIVCTVCGYNSIADFNFCPNCGADMREVSECSEEKQV